MLCVLGFRMAVLTIVQGEEYRAVADVKKIKDIPVKKWCSSGGQCFKLYSSNVHR